MRLDVLIERHHAGHVDILGGDKAVFRYAQSYLAVPEPTPLSVGFPLREDPYDSPQVAYWLQNLLPDDREVLMRWSDRYGASLVRPIELLGTPVGADCAGAVQFCRPDRTADLLSDAGGLGHLSADELWEGLAKLRADSSYRFATAYGDTGRSLGGMQPKDALARLAGDRAPAVRRLVAVHAATPAESVAGLRTDRDEFVREAMAGRPGSAGGEPAIAVTRRR